MTYDGEDSSVDDLWRSVFSVILAHPQTRRQLRSLVASASSEAHIDEKVNYENLP